MLNNNVSLLVVNIYSILVYNTKNKIFFALKKLKIIHLTRKSGNYAPLCTINKNLTIYPITTALKEGKQLALQQLSVQFNCKLTFKCYITKRATKAYKVSYYIKGLARTKDRPLASILCKAVIIYILPSILYSTKAQYIGYTKLLHIHCQDYKQTINAKNGQYIDIVNKTLSLAC